MPTTLTPQTLARLQDGEVVLDWVVIDEPDDDRVVAWTVADLQAAADRAGMLYSHIAITRRGHVLETWTRDLTA